MRKAAALAAVIAAVIVISAASGAAVSADAKKTPFTWRGKEVTEFPYSVKQYPKEMKVTADGKDILRGETFPGVTYSKGRITLNNAHIDDKLYIKLTGSGYAPEIVLIGDNYAEELTVNPSGFSKVSVSGSGTLEVKSIKFVPDTSYRTMLTIKENARVTVSEDRENVTKLREAINASCISVRENGFLECSFLSGEELCLTDNAEVKTVHCETSSIFLSGSSVMEVESDYEKYPKLEVDYALTRGMYYIETITIEDDARLTQVSNTGAYGIFCYGNYHGKITVSDNGTLDVSGSSYYGVSLGDCAFGSFEMNGNSRVRITGFTTALLARRIDINGGTLEIDSNGNAIQVYPRSAVSPYSSFEPGFYVNGETVSVSADGEEKPLDYGWQILDTDPDNYHFCVIYNDKGDRELEDFSITVREKVEHGK